MVSPISSTGADAATGTPPETGPNVCDPSGASAETVTAVVIGCPASTSSWVTRCVPEPVQVIDSRTSRAVRGQLIVSGATLIRVMVWLPLLTTRNVQATVSPAPAPAWCATGVTVPVTCTPSEGAATTTGTQVAAAPNVTTGPVPLPGRPLSVAVLTSGIPASMSACRTV